MLKTGQRSWELPEHRPNLTASRAAFKTYSTWVLPEAMREFIYKDNQLGLLILLSLQRQAESARLAPGGETEVISRGKQYPRTPNTTRRQGTDLRHISEGVREGVKAN